jgi:hypothetical protein
MRFNSLTLSDSVNQKTIMQNTLIDMVFFKKKYDRFIMIGNNDVNELCVLGNWLFFFYLQRTTYSCLYKDTIQMTIVLRVF